MNGGESSGRRTSVRVSIVGEEYSIRSDETAEHTRAVAEYVDAAIRRVMKSGAVVETQRAAILAMLQITDELFKTRQSSAELAAAMRSLGADVRRWLPPAKRVFDATAANAPHQDDHAHGPPGGDESNHDAQNRDAGPGSSMESRG